MAAGKDPDGQDTHAAVAATSFAAEGRTAAAQHILAATYRVLARNGFTGLTMSKIAHEAGVNKRMLHYYFDTKERLIEELADSLLTMLYTQLKVVTVGFEENPGAIFTGGVDRAWQVVTHNRELVAAYVSLVSQAVFDERLAKSLFRSKQLVRDMMVQDLGKLVATGNWRLQTSPEVIAELSVAMFQGFIVEWMERGEDEVLLEALDHGRKVILGLGEYVG